MVRRIKFQLFICFNSHSQPLFTTFWKRSNFNLINHSIICPQRPPSNAHLCTQAPCQSSCRQSGRHGAPNLRRGNNLADSCTPGCSRRTAGLDPPRQRWPGSVAACRSELGSEQRASVLAKTHLLPDTCKNFVSIYSCTRPLLHTNLRA